MPKRLLNSSIVRGLTAGTLFWGSVWTLTAAGNAVMIDPQIKEFMKQTKVLQQRLIKEGVVKPLQGNPIGTFKPGSFDESKLSEETISMLKAHRQHHKELTYEKKYYETKAYLKSSDFMRKSATIPSVGLGAGVALYYRRKKKKGKRENMRKTQHRR